MNAAQADRLDLAQALTMLSALVKAFEGVQSSVLAQALLPSLAAIWPTLQSILETRSQDNDIIVMICGLVQRLLKALGEFLRDLFIPLIRSLHLCFQLHPLKNFACLNLFFQGCRVLKHDPQVLETIRATFNDISACLL